MIYEVLLFLCEWDSRAKTLRYLMRDWPQRKTLKVGYKYGQHLSQAEWHKILLLPLNIKFVLMKNFAKPMDRTGSAFKYLKNFLDSTKRKLKVGFCGSSDSQALQRRYVQQLVQRDEKKVWDAFPLVSTNFLGNIRANYKELMTDMSLYHKIGCNMSLKINMFHSHSEIFLENCGIFSDVHGEMFMRKM